MKVFNISSLTFSKTKLSLISYNHIDNIHEFYLAVSSDLFITNLLNF